MVGRAIVLAAILSASIFNIPTSSYAQKIRTSPDEPVNPKFKYEGDPEEVLSCDKDWRGCADNQHLIEEYKEVSLFRAMCRRQVDRDNVYGEPDWDDGWFSAPFTSFYEGYDYVRDGILVLVDSDVRIQNMYGAMRRSVVLCEVDLRKENIISIEIH